MKFSIAGISLGMWANCQMLGHYCSVEQSKRLSDTQINLKRKYEDKKRGIANVEHNFEGDPQQIAS